MHGAKLFAVPNTCKEEKLQCGLEPYYHPLNIPARSALDKMSSWFLGKCIKIEKYVYMYLCISQYCSMRVTMMWR